MKSKITGIIIIAGLLATGIIFTTPKCHALNDRPDPKCSPGAILSVTVAQICTPGYSASVRNVPQSEKNQVLKEYGFKSNPGEIDHLIPLELGGSNDIKNLWPQTNYKAKDNLENVLHRQLCQKKITLPEAQTLIKNF